MHPAFDGPASLLFSCWCWCVGGVRGYGDGCIPYAWLSGIALLPWLPDFLHWHFPPGSPPSHPLNLSVHSQQQRLPWDCSTIPKLQLPAVAPSRRLAFLSGKCMAAARTVWFSFHLSFHRSAVSLSALNVSPLTQTIAPMWGSDPCFSFPQPPREGPVLLTLLFFPQFLCPTKFCVVLYILFRCSGTLVCSQLVFCLHFYIWRCVPDVSLERDVFVYLLLSHLVWASTVDVLNSKNIGFCGFFFKVKVIWWMEVYGLWPPSHWEKDGMPKDKACGQSVPGGSAQGVGIELSTVCSLSADCIQL